MARLYTNENFPFPAVIALRKLGHDVLTIQEVGRADQSTPDEAVLEYSSREKRILVTLNRKHFIRLHEQRTDHSGILVCSFDSDFVALANRIHKAVIEHPDLSGLLVRINRTE